MRNFRELEIWQRSMQLVKKTYEVTKDFPDYEKFGLKSQMQRAAVSIPSNIAEGCSRNGQRDFKRFLEIAIGSAFELETQMLLAADLNYVQKDVNRKLVEEINSLQKQMNTFISYLKKISPKKKVGFVNRRNS